MLQLDSTYDYTNIKLNRQQYNSGLYRADVGYGSNENDDVATWK